MEQSNAPLSTFADGAFAPEDVTDYLRGGGDPNACIRGTSLLYRAARAGNADAVRSLLLGGAQESLLRPGPNGSYPMHAAACAKALDCILLLYDEHVAHDRHFHPSQLVNAFGETPLDNAGSHEQCRKALGADWEPAEPEAASVPHRPRRTLNRSFVYAVAESPLIGDRHVAFERDAVPLADIVDGVLLEGRRFIEGRTPYAQWVQLRNKWTAEEMHEQGEHFWHCHLSAATMAERLTAAWDTGELFPLFREAVFLYSVESFLYRALNSAVRTRDASQAHLAPFLKLLHGALRFFPMEQRYSGRGFRCINLSDEEKALYRAHPRDPSLDFFSWDGFTSVSTTPRAGLELLLKWKKSTLFVVTPADASDRNCCPVRVAEWSAYPEECEALYPLGQQFQVVASDHRPWEEVCAWLDVHLEGQSIPPPSSWLNFGRWMCFGRWRKTSTGTAARRRRPIR